LQFSATREEVAKGMARSMLDLQYDIILKY
jgi:hypothetical protein